MPGDVQITLKKFDITRITGDKVVVMIGRRNTGKSHMVKNLLYYHRDTPIASVISPTERANKFYSDIVPPLFIHDEYTPEVVERFCKRQELVMNRVRKDEKLYRSSKVDPRGILIMDDCMYDSSWTKDKNVRMLFMNGRHYHVLFLITMQFPLGMPPNLRLQVEFVFILRDNIIQNRKKTYESFAGMFRTFDMFCEVMDQCTENYECLVIDISAKSNRLEDQVFWYRAETTPDFRLCSQIHWDRCNTVDEDDMNEEDNQLQDVNSIRPKKAPSFTVKKTGTSYT
jgi:hypothetical protein